MGWDLPVDEFFPDRKKLLLLEGRPRDDAARARAARSASCAPQGRAATEWGRFAVEWHKKFAIPGACLVFGLLGLALSLGSKKEARSAAFALSIGGDLRLLRAHPPRRAGRRHRDDEPLALACGAPTWCWGRWRWCCCWLNHREAAFDPLDPAHYLSFVPSVRRGARPAGARPGARPRRPAAGGRGAHPAPQPALPVPPRPLHRALLAVGNVALVLLAFASIFFLGEFMDLIDDIQQHQVPGQGGRPLLRLPRLVQIGFTVAPIAVLVGVLVTLGLLARRNEITAMKAGGISVYRAAGPVLGMGLLSSLLLYGMQEWVLPADQQGRRRRPQRDQGPARRSPPTSSTAAGSWRATSASTTSTTSSSASPRPSAGSRSPARGGDFSVYGFSIYDVDPQAWDLRERRLRRPRGLERRRRAPTTSSGAGGAPRAPRPSFHAVRHASASGRSAATRAARSSRPPTSSARRSPPTRMGFGELRGLHRARSRPAGFDVAKLKVQLHRKLAFPMVGVVMTLLAVPVLVRGGAARGALRHRHRDRDRDRVLGRPGDLRGARATTPSCTRPSPPGPRTSSSARPGCT